jgi:hypothetical protein
MYAMSFFSGFEMLVAYRIKDTWYGGTGNNRRPDDAVWCSQMIEQDSRAECQPEYWFMIEALLTSGGQMVLRKRSGLVQYVHTPL